MGMLQVCNSNLAHVWSSLLGLRELVLCDPPLSQSKKPAATIFLELQVLQLSSTKLPTLLQDNMGFVCLIWLVYLSCVFNIDFCLHEVTISY